MDYRNRCRGWLAKKGLSLPELAVSSDGALPHELSFKPELCSRFTAVNFQNFIIWAWGMPSMRSTASGCT